MDNIQTKKNRLYNASKICGLQKICDLQEPVDYISKPPKDGKGKKDQTLARSPTVPDATQAITHSLTELLSASDQSSRHHLEPVDQPVSDNHLRDGPTEQVPMQVVLMGGRNQ